MKYNMKRQVDAKILLGKILQRFQDIGYAKVASYNAFKRVSETNTSVIVLREKGTEAIIPFSKILAGIKFYQENPAAYDKGPSALRKIPITHITSPVFTLLHLLPKKAYLI